MPDHTTAMLLHAAVIGTGATLVMDAWAILRKRLLGVPALNYGLVGRWLAWLPRGRVHHQPIAATPPVRGEQAIGWIAHYLTGIAFAGILLALWGLDWARQPTLAPALIVGIASVAAPFLLLQPAMGAGIAASRTPRPNVARVHSLVTHVVFGVGMYVAGWVARLIADPNWSLA
ncbi:DUF2938 domain-containing protein [Cupriavidus taiwanensis]|uniref:DUF2938 domain-containing protein n=1 Tax=Cupriavidus taiwanensis TaxID=164546 RepID=UPI000E1000CC|nr:DUF2938 domain-containing protein [Cupriavidus taiwanensis]SPA47565.1 conserved hypothetical protein; putative membrane protein [Cupriavidus taiwanensis]